MTKTLYSFTDGAPFSKERGRSLPMEKNAPLSARVAGEQTFPLSSEEDDALTLSEEILADLCTFREREGGKRISTHFPDLYRLIGQYCLEYSAVTVTRPELSEGGTTVEVSSHALLFCLGAVLYTTDRKGRPCLVGATSNREVITLFAEVDVASDSEDGAADAFFLTDTELSVLKKIAEVSLFSVKLLPGVRSRIEFSLSIRPPQLLRTSALSDPWLRRAFFLPCDYFL